MRSRHKRLQTVSSANPTWEHTVRIVRDLTQGVTTDLTAWLLTDRTLCKAPAAQRAFMKKVLEVVTDPDPDLSLSVTAQDPFPYFRQEYLGSGAQTPQEKWQLIGRGSRFWPEKIRRAARPLGLDSGKIPNWTRVEKFFNGLGFRPVPVRDYVGNAMYSFLISQDCIPVCTTWVLRHKRAPYFFIPADFVHDLGHGLAMAMPDYRDLLIRFAKTSLQAKGYIGTQRLTNAYYRYFEYPYSYSRLGEVEPIGPTSLTFENVKFDRKGYQTVVRDASAVRKQKIEFRPFYSREEWARKTESFIETMAQ